MIRMLNVCEVISSKFKKSVNKPFSMSMEIMLLYSTANIYNDEELYLFSTFFLLDDKISDAFLLMESEQQPSYLHYAYEKSKQWNFTIFFIYILFFTSLFTLRTLLLWMNILQL